MEFISHSEKETSTVAKELAKEINAGDVIALYGDLGSGKTTFVRFLAKELGVKQNITSPTFVIMKEYYLPKSINGITHIYHLDCYRFKDERDGEAIGLGEIVQGKDSITLIEWPEVVENILPKNFSKIHFTYVDQSTRKILYER